MKLYKVDQWTYELANSLLPPRDPIPEETSQVEAGLVSPTGKELVDLFIRLGYSPHYAELLYKALFNHYWYDFGLRDVFKCNSMIYYWQQTYLAPAWKRAAEKPPPLLPPMVIHILAVTAIVAVVVLLVAPEFYKIYKWTPPCDSYIGVYDEMLWWLTLVHRDTDGRLWYREVAYGGPKIAAHTYEYVVPPVVTDRFHFWGTLEYRCWQIPWFRVYRAQHVDTTFIGLLERVGGDFFMLRKNFDDPFAPPGYFEILPPSYCTAFSPCHA